MNGAAESLPLDQGPPLQSSGGISLEAWASLPEDEPGEIVDGALVEEETVGFGHDVIALVLAATLRAWLGKGGAIGGSDTRLAVSSTRGRKPDLLAYFAGSKKPSARGLVRVPPDIAVEVVSPTPRDARRDRVEKLREYAAFGVKWYWIVDPQLRTFEVLELGESKRYIHVLGETEGAIAVPGCEGLTIDLNALWAELDQLEEGEDEPAQEPTE